MSAFLLFSVQPLMARAVLPWFGGSASVWTTSLLFYQVLLFVGYLYAHLGRRLGVQRQAMMHAALVVITFALLPVTPSEAWRPTGSEAPTLLLLGLLTASVGGPYVLLAGTTPLLHHWFAAGAGGQSPYKLYAVSNAGSLLALLAYPTVIEPILAVRFQGMAWSWAFVGFGIGLGALAWLLRGASGNAPTESVTEGPAQPVHARDVVFWAGAAACGTGLLMAVTNAITMDIASIPLLWVVPLALYLVTFIAAFAKPYKRGTWGALLVLCMGGAMLLWAGGFALPVLVQVLLGCSVLVSGCMVCHGELARSAPSPEHLTAFYLTMAGGGALGGLSVAVLAPLTLSDFYEFPGFVLASYVVLMWAMQRDPESPLRGKAAGFVRGSLISLGVLVAIGFALPTSRMIEGTLASTRNFYGVLRVQDAPLGLLADMRVMRHGRIFHGAQYLDSTRHGEPTAYFTEGSGSAEAIRGHPKRLAQQPLRVGVVGLGVGTLAAWGRPGDVFRFYEINPAADILAREHFDYLSESDATIEVVLGDGRIMLEQEFARDSSTPPYDLLIVDAFSGDAVPVHLLTLESMRLYQAALAPGGAIVFQITNRHVDLERVVRGLAEASDMQALRIDHDPVEGSGGIRNAWMWLASEGTPAPPNAQVTPPTTSASVLWTDDFSNLLGVLR